MTTAQNLETGHVIIPLLRHIDPELTRSDAARAAERDGGQIVGDPELIQPDQFEEFGIPDNGHTTGLEIVRWTMVRERTDG